MEVSAFRYTQHEATLNGNACWRRMGTTGERVNTNGAGRLKVVFPVLKFPTDTPSGLLERGLNCWNAATPQVLGFTKETSR